MGVSSGHRMEVEVQKVGLTLFYYIGVSKLELFLVGFRSMETGNHFLEGRSVGRNCEGRGR